MTSGNEQLRQMIDSLGDIAKIAETAAPDVALVVRASVRRTIGAGTTAEGKKWIPTQDGSQPLQGAAAELYVVAIGNRVHVRIGGPEARHHLGRVNGGRARPIIPISSQVPDTMAAGIAAVLDRHFREAASAT